MSSYRRSPHSPGLLSPPANAGGLELLGWLFFVFIVVATILIAGAPVVALAFIAQRLLKRHVTIGWRVLILLLSSVLAGWILYQWWSHGLQIMLFKAIDDYSTAIKHYQSNIDHWPWKQLWAETWPIWIRTLVALPPVTLFMECADTTRENFNAAHKLIKAEQQRQRKNLRYQQRAKNKASGPQRVPLTIGGMMAMGVPIKRRKDSHV